tara:strand:+ start:498 stop:977 length:480 start_codon:yes stop_codon:yes gene_type:complete
MAEGTRGLRGPRERASIAQKPFSGAKIVLKFENRLLAYLRDDKPDILFPGRWDLPGGGREGSETPAECAMREVEEEFGLRIPVSRVVWNRRYPSPAGRLDSCFLVAPLLEGESEQIVFGSEGRRWRMVTFARFLARKDAVPDLQARLADFIATGRSAGA